MSDGYSFIRTVVGDVPADPAALGMCSAHEHLVIDHPFMAAHFADFLLDDVDAAFVDVEEFRSAGGGWVVDTMPGGCGRSVTKLRAITARTGVYVVASTGLHLPMYYADDDPILREDREALAERFQREVTDGVEEAPGGARAGVIKVAGGRDRLSDQQAEAFAAAGRVAAETGCPVITHTEAGTAGLEQIDRLVDAGAVPAQIVLSHTDAKPESSYHRDLLQTGVTLEYDQHFRTLAKTGTCPTLDLIVALIGDFPDQIVVGMDLARRRYWHGRGGEPGLAWLVTHLPGRLRECGLSEGVLQRIFCGNPARAFAFVPSASPMPEHSS
ncbi:MAG: hypothetical protein AAF750_01280 [Planctomycetota bacterium]